MISWAGFLGKLAEFILSKLVDKTLDASFDEKKKAARAFLEFYETLAEIENLTATFVARTQPLVAGEKSRIYSAWLASAAERFDSVSPRFLAALRGLQAVIHIYDPTLSRMLRGIHAFKTGLLLPGISQSLVDAMTFRLVWDGGCLKSVEYSSPSRQLMRVDLEEGYSFIQGIPSTGRGRGSVPAEWPDGALRSLILDSSPVVSASPDDTGKLKKLHSAAEQYLPLLTAAREHLGIFVRDNFSIEDLLYVHRPK